MSLACTVRIVGRRSHHFELARRSIRLFSSTPSPPSPPHHSKSKDDDEKNEQKHKPSIYPGIALSAATAGVGFQSASMLSSLFELPVSGIPLSILFGIAIKNKVGHYDPSTFQPGVQFATKKILQGGIVAVAAKLSFYELMTTGSQTIPVVLASVGAGLIFIPMAGRLAGLPNKMSLLLTVGTSICGVTAITALAPAINASNRDMAVAVANTVAFGTMGMLTYPYLFHTLCSSPEQIGMCLGVGIHDTSQVLGSAMSYSQSFGDDTALRVATITKLTRNLGLAFAIPGLTFVHKAMLEEERADGKNETMVNNSSSSDDDDVTKKKTDGKTTISGLVTFQKYVPNFLVAFVGVSALRSGGDFYVSTSTAPGGDDIQLYHDTMNFIGKDISKYALGTAMAGVGLSTDISSLRGVGWRPFAVGGAGALVVGATGFTVASCIL